MIPLDYVAVIKSLEAENARLLNALSDMLQAVEGCQELAIMMGRDYSDILVAARYALSGRPEPEPKGRAASTPRRLRKDRNQPQPGDPQ